MIATFPFERRLRIAGIEVLLRCDQDGVIERVTEKWLGYESNAGPIDILHEFSARADFARSTPAGRPYPGFDCRVIDVERTFFERADTSGELFVPTDAARPVHARMAGRPKRGALESTLRLAMCAALWHRGGMMFHSAGLAGPNGAMIFPGQSEAGKSTLSKLLGPHANFLGDEMIAVRPIEGTWMAYATPFGGECAPAKQGSGPLLAVNFLKKSERHLITRVPSATAIPLLLRNTLAYVKRSTDAAALLQSAHELSSQVACHHFEFRKDDGVRHVLATLGIS